MRSIRGCRAPRTDARRSRCALDEGHFGKAIECEWRDIDGRATARDQLRDDLANGWRRAEAIPGEPGRDDEAARPSRGVDDRHEVGRRRRDPRPGVRHLDSGETRYEPEHHPADA